LEILDKTNVLHLLFWYRAAGHFCLLTLAAVIGDKW